MNAHHTFLHSTSQTSLRGAVYILSTPLPGAVSGPDGAPEGLPGAAVAQRAGTLPAAADGSVGGSNGPRNTPSTMSLEYLRDSFELSTLVGLSTPNVFESDRMIAYYGLSLNSNVVSHTSYGISPTIHLGIGRNASTKRVRPTEKHLVEGRFAPIRHAYSPVFSVTREAAGESSATGFSNASEFIVRLAETLKSTALPTKFSSFLKVSRFALEVLRDEALALGFPTAAREASAVAHAASQIHEQVNMQAEYIGALGKPFETFQGISHCYASRTARVSPHEDMAYDRRHGPLSAPASPTSSAKPRAPNSNPKPIRKRMNRNSLSLANVFRRFEMLFFPVTETTPKEDSKERNKKSNGNSPMNIETTLFKIGRRIPKRTVDACRNFSNTNA